MTAAGTDFNPAGAGGERQGRARGGLARLGRPCRGGGGWSSSGSHPGPVIGRDTSIVARGTIGWMGGFGRGFAVNPFLIRPFPRAASRRLRNVVLHVPEHHLLERLLTPPDRGGRV